MVILLFFVWILAAIFLPRSPRRNHYPKVAVAQGQGGDRPFRVVDSLISEPYRLILHFITLSQGDPSRAKMAIVKPPKKGKWQLGNIWYRGVETDVDNRYNTSNGFNINPMNFLALRKLQYCLNRTFLPNHNGPTLTATVLTVRPRLRALRVNGRFALATTLVAPQEPPRD